MQETQGMFNVYLQSKAYSETLPSFYPYVLFVAVCPKR